MASITLTDSTISGFTVTTQSASSGGDYLINNGNTLLYIENNSLSSINLTIDSPNQCSQGHYHDEIIAVASGAKKFIGVLNQKQFNDSNGRVNITYSAYADVLVGGIKI